MNYTSLHNSRDKATLAASATWQGMSEDISRYGTMGVSFASSNPTDGTLWIEVSHDNETFTAIPRTIANTTTAQPVMWTIVEKYIRLKYVNNSTEVEDFSIQTHYSSNSGILLGQELGDSLTDSATGIATVSVVQGKDSSGGYNTATVDSGGSLKILESSASTNTELLTHIYNQLHLLNVRFEEAFRTGITLEDIENGYD
jgi:hypothetical protein